MWPAPTVNPNAGPAGKRSGWATSMAAAFPTFCCGMPMVKPQSALSVRELSAFFTRMETRRICVAYLTNGRYT